MLERAKEKAFQAELKIDFIEADIRELNLGEKFYLIFIPFNSIHHLYKKEDLFLKTRGSNRLLPNIQPMTEEKY